MQRFLFFALPFGILCGVGSSLQAQSDEDEPLRHTVQFNGSEREYFVRLPVDFDTEKSYWPLFAIHGGSMSATGQNYWMAKQIRQECDRKALDAIVICPTFARAEANTGNTHAFPGFGEGDFFKKVIQDLRSKYRVKERILLVGYSRGGQFTHRFTFQNPELIEAAAPLAPGGWTTPSGDFWHYEVGQIRHDNVGAFLTSTDNALSGELARFAQEAGLPSKPGTKRIPFLIMCGTLDPRIGNAKLFAQRLRESGYKVEVGWPEVPHSNLLGDKYGNESLKFFARTVDFFLQVTAGN